MIEVILPGPPKGKGRPRFSHKTGHAYTPAQTVTYENALRAEAFKAMNGQPPIEGALEVDVYVGLPIPQSWPKSRKAAALEGSIRPTGKPDWENVAKMLDAFNEVVWRDDAQVVDGRVRMFYTDTPRLEVRVDMAGLAFME